MTLLLHARLRRLDFRADPPKQLAAPIRTPPSVMRDLLSRSARISSDRYRGFSGTYYVTLENTIGAGEWIPYWYETQIYAMFGAQRQLRLIEVLENTEIPPRSRWWSLCRIAPDLEERIIRLLACDAVEAVLPLYEQRRPGDSRPRDITALGRQLSHGEASESVLKAAWREARAFAEAARGMGATEESVAEATAVLVAGDTWSSSLGGKRRRGRDVAGGERRCRWAPITGTRLYHDVAVDVAPRIAIESAVAAAAHETAEDHVKAGTIRAARECWDGFLGYAADAITALEQNKPWPPLVPVTAPMKGRRRKHTRVADGR